MFKSKSITLILPTFAERQSIREVIRKFEVLGILDEIIVVNNNAEEGTSQEVSSTSAREEFETQQGYGAALQRGLAECDSELIVFCEPDGTFEPFDLLLLLSQMEKYDLVIGSRTHLPLIESGANMGFLLRNGNVFMAKLLGWCFQAPLAFTDAGCTFRVFNRAVKSTTQENCVALGSEFGFEMMISSLQNNLKVIQIPVSYKKRVGVSSATGSFWVSAKIALGMFWLLLRKRQRGKGTSCLESTSGF